MSSTCTQSHICTATPNSSLSSVFTFHFGYSLCLPQHLLYTNSCTCNHVSSEMIDTCGIHHWEIFRRSYTKLAWVGFEPTTTEFRSDAPTDWAIRPWVKLALIANFIQLLQFDLSVQCSHFISAIPFMSCFEQNLTQVTTLAVEWFIDMVFITEGFFELAIESWPDWDLNPQAMNSAQML